MADTKIETIQLETPIVRGDSKVTHVQLRKPAAGELRGLKMGDIMQSDVSTHLKLLPRICDLVEQEIEQLDLPDLAALIGTVVGFFMTADQRGMAKKVLENIQSTI